MMIQGVATCQILSPISLSPHFLPRRLDQPAHAALKTQLQAASPSPLYAGYGCSTLVLLAQDALNTSPPRQLLPHAGGLPEYVTSRLINKPSPSMGPSMAAAWGFLAARDQAPAWDTEALRRALKDQPGGLADHVISRLPPLVPAGTCLGTLAKHVADLLGLPPRIPVLAAMGDNQAQVAAQAKADLDGPVTIPALSALATGPETPAFLNVGTSAQLTILVPQESDTQALSGMVERRPFVAGVDLLVVASLNGGNVLRALAAFCCTSQSDAAPQGQQPPSDENRAMCRLERLPYVPHSRFPHLECSPRLFGERGAEEDRFAIAGIDAPALACPGALESALCRGLISNMTGHILTGLERRIAIAYAGGQATVGCFQVAGGSGLKSGSSAYPALIRVCLMSLLRIAPPPRHYHA